MSKPDHISDLLLEQYRIGEVTPGEKRRIEKALARDPALAQKLSDLDTADRYFCQRFPRERFLPGPDTAGQSKIIPFQKSRRFMPPAVWMACAAALMAVIALPILVIKNPFQQAAGDRSKGPLSANAIELSVFMNQDGKNIQLADQSGVREGDTIQLAYRVKPDSSGKKYGVIFSIDGRKTVTLHYPYNPEQSTQLVTGSIVPLDEAYTLDDAPYFEIFFFVAGTKSMNVQSILSTAQWLSFRIGNDIRNIQKTGKSAFNNYDVQIVTLLKE